MTRDPPVPLFQLTIDDTGFLINGDEQRIIWVPAHLRGDKVDVHGKTVAIGGYIGSMTFIRFGPGS